MAIKMKMIVKIFQIRFNVWLKKLHFTGRNGANLKEVQTNWALNVDSNVWKVGYQLVIYRLHSSIENTSKLNYLKKNSLRL